MRTTSNLARRVIRFFLVTTWALLLPTQLMAAEALEIGTRKQLFLDDHIIESLTPGIFAVLNQPLKYSGNPLIRMDRCWEADMSFTEHSNVLYDREEGPLQDVEHRSQLRLVTETVGLLHIPGWSSLG